MMKYAGITGSTLALLALSSQCFAAPVDLSTWAGAEGGGNWTIAGDQNSVFQSVNGDPTVFHSGTDSQGLALSGTITVEATSDDDFIGFVLGYHSGDLVNPSADYLLIDWKQSDQGGFFGGVAQAGLAISRVTGELADNSGAWLHDPSNNVTELQRGSTLSDTGWADNTTYTFDLLFTATKVEVKVNGNTELSIAGIFTDGAFGFYNYSQASVRYAGLQEDVLPPLPPVSEVPLPAGGILFLSAIGGFAGLRRRKS